MAMATLGLVVGSIFATQISHVLFATDSRANLVRAALVLLWAQMNYEQLTSLFRVEERSVSYVAATLANVIITVVATILLVAVWHKGAIGVIVGNFTGTLVGLLRPARLPPLPARARVRPRPLPPDAALRPAARALGPRALGDRPLRPLLPDPHERARRDRRLLGRRPDLDRDPARADRAADRLAGLRLLDQGRRRGQAHVRLRAHLRALPLLLALARALAARAVARAPAVDAEVLPGRGGRAAARLRRDGVHRLQRDVDRDRPREEDAVQLGRSPAPRRSSTSGSTSS